MGVIVGIKAVNVNSRNLLPINCYLSGSSPETNVQLFACGTFSYVRVTKSAHVFCVRTLILVCTMSC